MSSRSDGISLVVCTIGNLDLLSRCLASVSQQLRRNDQLVLVDLRFHAEVKALAASLHADYVVQTGRGISDARNAGIAIARGPTVVFLDDDCEVLDGWREGVAVFAAGDLAAASGPVDGPRTNLPSRWGYHAYRDPAARRWSLIGCNMAFRRSALDAEPFDPAFTFGFDETDVEIRLMRRGLAVGRMPARVFHHHRLSWSALARQQAKYSPRSVQFRRKHGLQPRIPWKHALLPLALLSLATWPWIGGWALVGLGLWSGALAYEARKLGGSWVEAVVLWPVQVVVATSQAWGLAAAGWRR